MALKGKQYKLDKNKDGTINEVDFELMRKSGYKMGGEFKMNDSDRMTKRDIERASNAVQGKKYKTGPMPGNKAAAASMSTDRMTRRDNEIASRAVGKKIGGEMKQESKGRRMSKDELKLAKEMSKRNRYQSYAKNEKTRAFKTPKEAAEVDIKLQKLVDYNVKKGDPVDVDVIGMKSYEKPTSKMGSFRIGGLSRQRLDSISNYRNKQAQMKKEKQKEENIRKTEISPMAAKSGKFMDRRKKLGSLKSLFKSVGDFPLVSGTGESAGTSTGKFLKRRMKLSGGKKMGGVMKAKSGDLADTMKKLRKKAYEKSMKKNKKVGKFGDDEYLIQKPLPGMKKGKMIKAKTGKSVDTIKITPTIKGKPLKARPFMKSKFDRGVMSRDYKFSKK